FKKIRNFFRDLFSVFSGTNKSTSTLLKSFKNIVDDNLINSLDSDKLKVKDLAVQSQISMQIDDKYNLFCHPIHNISGSVLAYKMTNSSSSEAIDLKVSTAERAFQAASSVLNVECQEFLNGRPPMGEDELKHRFRFDTKKDSRAYESAKLGRPADITSAKELQHLYSNLLLLESEMSEFRDQIKVDSQVDSQISSPDLDEAIASYESDLSIAKELIDAKAQEMGVNLQDVKAKTLADDISDTASDTLSYYESTISDSEKSSDIGDSEKSSEETKESDGQPKLKQLHARVDHSKLISGSFLEHEIAKREKSGKSEDHTH
ncbi:MAG: hypothetical protein HOM96_03640, partial [Rickettsiales bacterium]|nr:hypothetical protein [Rickettsiales bacterium]